MVKPMTNENEGDNAMISQPGPNVGPTEEQLRERAKTLTDLAAKQAEVEFRDAVRPVYGVTRNGLPDQLGSSVLFEIDGVHSIITAAHVIDENKTTTLYVGGNDSLIPLIADFDATKAPGDDRDRDHHDFAVATLPDAMLVEMNRLKFITENEIVPREFRGERTYLTALGYPNTKNKAPRPGDATVRAELFLYSEFDRPSAALAQKLGISGEDHLFIRHGKHSRDEAGRKSSSVSPRGLSGGAIVHSADFASREVLLGHIAPIPRLAGITIELYRSYQTLLGTRIHAVLDAVRRSRCVQSDLDTPSASASRQF